MTHSDKHTQHNKSSMPVLHWRDQEKANQRAALLQKKKRFGQKSKKYKVVDNNGGNNDARTENDNQENNGENLTPLSQSPRKRTMKQSAGPATSTGYDTVDTVTGPSENDNSEASDEDNSTAEVEEEEEEGRRSSKMSKISPNLRVETDRDNSSDTTDEMLRSPADGPESNVEDDDDVESGYGSSVDYGIDYEVDNDCDVRVETEVKQGATNNNVVVDAVKQWRDQRAEDLADKARRQCNNCDATIAAWRCHGCNYSYCEKCNRDTHALYCSKYRPKDHVLQRVDGMPLACGRCKKGVWEIAMHGYDHFQHQYQRKRREKRHDRMKHEIDIIKEKVADQRSIFKRERKGNRLRQAQQDKLSEMFRKGKEEAETIVKAELDKIFAPMLTPLHFDPKQLLLERGNNGQPIVPPPVDDTGRCVAMFSFDFNRNTILCRACNIFWNSGPTLGRRTVVNAYAPVGPIIDPQAAARRTVQRIHDSKIHGRLMEKLKLEAEAKARLMKPPKKSRMCVVM